MDMQQKIREVLNKVKPGMEIGESDDLIRVLGIDSHDIFNIIAELEEMFHIEIEPIYLKAVNFSSIARIEKMIYEIKESNRG